MVKLLFALIFGLIWKGSLAQLTIYTCDPTTDCATIAVAGALVPDPNNCNNYFVCINVGGEIVPSTSSVPCPDGEYFDQSLRSCRLEDSAGNCGPNVCTINFCTTKCPPVYEVFTVAANNLNCSSYYACLESSPVLVPCPSDAPYFDGSSCVTDASKCCDICTAYCSEAGTQIVDPCDCYSYYICIDKGLALPNFRSTCTTGTYYDETTATCIAGTCTSICPDCGIINQTTTTSSANTTTTTPSAVTSTTTPTFGCQSLETFICPTDGSYPMCTFCNREYFFCFGGVAYVGKCTGNQVFNPNLQYPYCLDPSNCPYP